jgi:nucleoid-associated protein YgaU
VDEPPGPLGQAASIRQEGAVTATMSDISTGLSAVSNFGSQAETFGADALAGGTLQRAYLLILPPSSPAGGLAAAAMGAAGLAAEDLTGSSGGNTGNGVANVAETEFSGTVGNRIDFMFNPKQYTIEKSAKWEHSPDQASRPTATPVYVGSNQRSLSLEIFLDTNKNGWSGPKSVQTDVDLLFSCLQPTLMSVMLEEPSPPFVMFGWGENLSFLAYMESVRAEFQMFLPNGTPTRATCNIVMKEIPINLAKQNPTSGGRAQRTRTTVAGDTLASIATREYGRPTMWRAIAQANGIEDPTRVAPGTTLLIPPKTDAADLA